MTTPQCPDCHAPLPIESATCASCGLPLIGEDAAELGRIDLELAALDARLGALDSERTRLVARRGEMLSRRQAIIARLRAAVHWLATQHAPSPPEGTGQQASASLRPAARVAVETSGYSVQAVLLALGGALLAVAAIAFTVFAWGRFGIPGRAAVLAALTGVTFAVPAVLVRRRLTSTAETIAVLGLVLLTLDGYAAWRVGLSGAMSGPVYAGLVTAAVTLAGALYPLAVPVRLPRLAAIVTGQAVLPLLLSGVHGLPWGATAALVAAADLAVVAGMRRRGVRPELVLAALAGTVAGSLAVLGALTELAVGRPIPGALLLAALAGLGLLAAEVAGQPLARQAAAAAALPALCLGGFRVEVAYGHGWALTAAAALALAAVALGRVVPAAWRRGALMGAATVTGVSGVLPVGAAAISLLAPVGWVTRPWSIGAADAVQLAPGVQAGHGVDFAVALVVLTAAATALAAALFGRSHARYVAAAGAGLCAVVLPAALNATVWAAVLTVVVVAGALAMRFAPAALVLTVHAALLALSSEPVSLVALAAITLGWGAVAVVRRRSDGPLLASGAVAALLALSAEVAAVACAVHAPRLVVAYALVVSSVAAFGAALRLPRTAAMAALCVVPVVAYTGALTGLGATDRAGGGLLAALTAAALAGFGAALRRTSGNRVFGATPVLGLLGALAAVAEPVARTALTPLGRLTEIWAGAPATTRTGSWLDVLTLAVLAVAAAALADTYGRSRAAAAAAPVAAAALLATQAPWALALTTSTLLALAAAALAVHRRHPVALVLTAVLGAITLASSLATRPSTLIVLALAVAAGAAAARFESSRAVGQAVGSLAFLAEAYAGAAAAGLPPHQAAYAVLAGAAVLAAVRQTEPWAVLGGCVALTLTFGHWSATATVLTLGGVVAGVVAALRADRRHAAWGALALELIASWVWLGTAGVTVPEAYTLPAAVLGLGAGLWAQRRDPSRSSWVTLAPGLAAALAPSLALVFGPAGTPWRPLLLGAAALGLTLAGAARSRQAPFVLGAAVLALVAARQLWPYLPVIAAAVPTWVPLACGGLLLVTVGATYERRLQEVARVRAAVGRMR